MSFFQTEFTDRGVRQDFPLLHDTTTHRADIQSGFIKPTDPVLIHPELQGVALTNASITTNSKDLLKGYYYESETLTANRTLTLPSAASIAQLLIAVLQASTSKIPGTYFVFSLDNTQAGAFTRTLVAGAGVTLQGPGFSVAQNEIALFVVYVHSSTAVSVARADLGASTLQSLAQTLVVGNVTGGTNIVISSGDSITAPATLPVTATGQLALTSTQAAATAVRILASNAAGGIDVDAGTGGIDVLTTGGLSLDATATSNLTTSVGTLTVSAIEAAAGGVLVLTSLGTTAGAVDINSSGGITVDYLGTSTMPVTSGGTVIATFGTSAIPNLTVNNGNVVFATPTRSIVSGPIVGVVGAIAPDAVTTDGTMGIIVDSGPVGPGSRIPIAVTNASVTPASQIFIQVSGDTTAGQSVSLITSVLPAGGSYILNVFNTDVVPTLGTPSYRYLVVNPA